MSAATAARVATSRAQTNPQSAPQKASTKIFQGTIVMLDSSGRALPGATATGCVGGGVARSNSGMPSWDNTSGADGDLHPLYDEGIFGPFANSGSSIAVGDEGKDCYIVDDQTVHRTDGSGTRSPAGRIHSVVTGGVFVDMSARIARAIAEAQIISTGNAYTQTYATADRTVAAPTDAALTDSSTGSAGATIAAGVGVTTLSFPINLASITGSQDVLTNYTPGYKFKILSIDFAVNLPATTAAKLATLNMEIGTTNLTGGTVALTSANCTPMGNVVAGAAVTAGNTGTSTDNFSIEASGVTAFVEGNGYLLVKIQNMDTADAFASLEAKHVLGIADDLDNRRTITALIDDLQTAGVVS